MLQWLIDVLTPIFVSMGVSPTDVESYVHNLGGYIYAIVGTLILAVVVMIAAHWIVKKGTRHVVRWGAGVAWVLIVTVLANVICFGPMYNNLSAILNYTGELTEERKNYIEDSFSDFEKSLYSYDYDNGSYKWQEWADVDDLVDYFLINEFTCNYDAGSLSTYFYRDIRGKYRMCIWDFNSACDNYYLTQTEPQHFQTQYVPWYYMLTKDEDFTEAVIERYRELRKTYFSDEYINDYVDKTVEYLGPAVERNFDIWGYTFEEFTPLEPDERNPENYEEAVQQIKDFCNTEHDRFNPANS